jgi:hypothetical protein
MVYSESKNKTLTPAELYTIGLEGVIRLGGDTDTNGCIYGGMAGAYFGFANLPEILVSKTVYVHFLKALSKSITHHKDMVTGNFTVDYDNKYLLNTSPEHTLRKPRKEKFLFGRRASYSMLKEYFNTLNITPSNSESDNDDDEETLVEHPTTSVEPTQ